ncbi:MAG: sterol desaturase/sphingolipid hydroxylase (fatty acid hydroxylase superfamily) [Glaciecola sp.]|jgi:sterol desaturase/sphingolipid hydroxylase (fatty acid hydroxylase superfamily)|uniref:sterol desaturase family protein n=1 Tax=Congregibacter sp. TaxID=2744308 RepID=UPI0039E6A4AB
MDLIEIEFASYASLLQVVEFSSLAFLIALVSETVWDTVRGKRKLPGDTVANSVIAVVTVLLERTIYGVAFIIGLVLITPFVSFELPHGWWILPSAIVAADFSYYWMHRCEHKVRIFWANHSVHHSSREFNFTTALRVSWMDGLIEWLFFIPMILLGFSVVETVVGLVIVVAYQSWIHTEKVGKLGWLDKVFNTPSVHRVHHGTNARYVDKNYGGILIVWDRLFGTFEPEEERVIYGLDKPITSHNPLIINFKEYLVIFRDVKRATNLASALGYVFRHPGWNPEPPVLAGSKTDA